MVAFDWVTNRANCSLRDAYTRAKTDVQQDAVIMNTLAQREVFQFKDNGEAFSIFVKNDAAHAPTVEFKLSGDCIVISFDGKELVKATVTLNDTGKCTLVVDGKEIEDWQFRKMALEPLFFGKR